MRSSSNDYGTVPADARPPRPMASAGYGGPPIAFEGGIRGGGVSEQETMPSQAVFAPKRGYDEHRRRGPVDGPGTVHEEAGVEGVEGGDSPGTVEPGNEDDAHEMSEQAATDTKMSDGFSCGHGACGMKARSKHGLARHVHAKHGYGSLGKAMHK